jgi:hypothetical protein
MCLRKTGIYFHHDLTPFFTVDNAQLEETDVDTIETLDPADVMDTDAFEELTQSVDVSSRRAINCTHVDSPPDNLEDCQQQTNMIEVGALETQTTAVVIDRFPSESAGTPILGIPPGSS